VLSLVAPVLRDQYHLSNTQYSAIVFGFLLGMAAGQLPVGALVDRIGAGRVWRSFSPGGRRPTPPTPSYARRSSSA